MFVWLCSVRAHVIHPQIIDGYTHVRRFGLVDRTRRRKMIFLRIATRQMKTAVDPEPLICTTRGSSYIFNQPPRTNEYIFHNILNIYIFTKKSYIYTSQTTKSTKKRLKHFKIVMA